MARADRGEHRAVRDRADDPVPGRGRSQRAGRRAALIAFALLALADDARADEIDEFISGRDAYINGEYPRAIRELRDLIDRTGAPELTFVRPAARKYLAASLFASRREGEARIAIADLLREDPRARLDGTSFEERFTRLFDDVVRSMEAELDRIVVLRAQARRTEENARDARRAIALDLLTFDSRAEVVPRGLMFFPFGVGQFANRQNGLGYVFLGLESGLLLGSVAMVLADQAVRSPTQPDGVFEQPADDDRAKAAFNLRVLNWTMLSAFVVTTAVGIWRANADYVPQRLTRVPRPLPPALQGVQISAQPGAMGASLHFTF